VDGLAWLKPISPPSAADEEPENMPFSTEKYAVLTCSFDK